MFLATPYIVEELLTNLPKLPATATADWARLRPNLTIMDDVVTLHRASGGDALPQ
jgi:hypothetical protein